MGKTKIEWCDSVWNVTTGCTKISEGCRNCYAERMSKRLAGRFGYPADEPFQVTLHEDRLEQPLRWRKPRRVFVCSMGDLFHEDVPDVFIDAVFSAMWVAAHHTFLVLTKRPERMATYVQNRTVDRLPIGRAWVDVVEFHQRGLRFSQHGQNWHGYCNLMGKGTMPRPNVWLGVTAENQKRADERMPLLLQTPAAKRFVSLEPLLGPVDLTRAMYGTNPPGMNVFGFTDGVGYEARLNWVICGAETGPGARPMDPQWARDIRDQCKAAGVPFFFKAMSGRAPIPDDLMIREWPDD